MYIRIDYTVCSLNFAQKNPKNFALTPAYNTIYELQSGFLSQAIFFSETINN